MTLNPPTGTVADSTKIALPNYTSYEHPSTKWLLNTFRKGATNRLIAMLKERPHLFRHTFQIFDSPSEVMADPSDTKCMFHSGAVLYLRPVCLAIYMRCKSAVQILLGSTLCDPFEYSYASDVYVQLQGFNGGDLLELLPACIAVRRQFWEVLPLIFHASHMSKIPMFTPRTPFTIRYLNPRMQRTTMFDDLFHYATDLALLNRDINIFKILEILVHQCPGFYVPGQLNEQKNAEAYSLFRRLAHLAVYIDSNHRISFPLIQCMELLVRNSHFRMGTSTTGRNTVCNAMCLTFKDVRSNWKEVSAWTKDCYICVALLFYLYVILVSKPKAGCVGHADNLLFKVLVDTNLLNSTLNMPMEELAEMLDFIIENDMVGREYVNAKQLFSDNKVQPGVCQGDNTFSLWPCPSDNGKRPSTCFTESLDILMQLITKLQNRDRLTQMKRAHFAHLSCLTRLPWAKYRFKVSRVDCHHHDEASSVNENILADRSLCVNRRRHSVEVSPTWEGGMQQDHLRRLKEYRIANTMAHRSRGTCSPTTKHQINDVNGIETRTFRRNIDTQTTQRALWVSEAYATGSLNVVRCQIRPHSAVVRLDTGIRDITGKHHCVDCNATPSTRSSKNHNGDYNVLTNITQTDLPSASDGGPSEQNHLPQLETTYCEKACQTTDHECSKAVSALILKRPSVEKLSLRDVDQLIDCIAMNALANEKELDGQTIEDLFRDYMEQGSFPSGSVSRANSSLGTQIYHDQVEAVGTIYPDTWEDGTHPTVVTPEGEHLTQSVRLQIKSNPDCGNAERGQQDYALTLLSSRPNDSDSPPNATTREMSSNYRKILWSCAKPISHLNVAIGALKHHISVNKKNDS